MKNRKRQRQKQPLRDDDNGDGYGICSNNHDGNQSDGKNSVNSSSSTSSLTPLPPPGVLRPPGRGWEGRQLEYDHRREQLKHDTATSSYAAVDVTQFQNTEVGKGYQAKHVVRQKVALPDETIVIHDKSSHGVTTPDDTVKKSDRKKKSKKKTAKEVKDSHKTKKRRREEDDENTNPKDMLQQFLQCRGLRDFRREIESILRSASKPKR